MRNDKDNRVRECLWDRNGREYNSTHQTPPKKINKKRKADRMQLTNRVIELAVQETAATKERKNKLPKHILKTTKEDSFPGSTPLAGKQNERRHSNVQQTVAWTLFCFVKCSSVCPSVLSKSTLKVSKAIRFFLLESNTDRWFIFPNLTARLYPKLAASILGKRTVETFKLTLD